MLLIHGGRSLLAAAQRRGAHDRLRAWGLEVARLRGHNRGAVAVANKLARICWALWRHGERYQGRPLEQAA